MLRAAVAADEGLIHAVGQRRDAVCAVARGGGRGCVGVGVVCVVVVVGGVSSVAVAAKGVAALGLMLSNVGVGLWLLVGAGLLLDVWVGLWLAV